MWSTPFKTCRIDRAAPRGALWTVGFTTQSAGQGELTTMADVVVPAEPLMLQASGRSRSDQTLQNSASSDAETDDTSVTGAAALPHSHSSPTLSLLELEDVGNDAHKHVCNSTRASITHKRNYIIDDQHFELSEEQQQQKQQENERAAQLQDQAMAEASAVDDNKEEVVTTATTPVKSIVRSNSEGDASNQTTDVNNPVISALESASAAPPSVPLDRRSTSLRGKEIHRGDSSLRIFFPTDDLALRAILSPPNTRSASASVLSRNSSTVEAPSDRAAAPSGGGGGINNFLEQSAKLFMRGVTGGAVGGGSASSSNGGGANAKLPSGSMVEEDLVKVNNSVVVMHSNLPPPPFANMFSCENCHEDIGTLLSKGRHHCRNCGGSFCAECSQKTAIVPFQIYLGRGEERVCDGCFHRIQEFHDQTESTSVTWSGLHPPSDETFIKTFDLPDTERPVTVFNCSFFVDFSPIYGHLFLTREHLCFQGYKNGKTIKLAYARIESLIKPSFYYINGLQVKTLENEKLFFVEFNGLRDLCFLRMDQLIRAYQEGRKQFMKLSADDLVQQARIRRQSYKIMEERVASGRRKSPIPSIEQVKSLEKAMSLANVSSMGYMDLDEDNEQDEDDDEDDEDDDNDSDDRKSTHSEEELFQPLPPDAPLSKMNILLDCDLHADIKVVFDLLWNDGMGQQFLYKSMDKLRDIDINIDTWQAMPPAPDDEEISKGFVIGKETDYSLYRYLNYSHPPKVSFPGLPAYAACRKTQRFRVEKANRPDGSPTSSGDKWDRFIISEMSRMSKIPFSDYFEIETRWVFSRDGKNFCHVQAGLVVHFLKSTWFKSQINSSTLSECKDVFEAWAADAMGHLKVHDNTTQRVPRSRTTKRKSLKNSETEESVEQTVEASVKEETDATERTRSKTESSSSEAQVAPTSSPSDAPIKPVLPRASSGRGIPGSFVLADLSSYVQWLLLVLVLYCLLVIRSQQTQLQQLTATTSLMLEKLQDRVASSAAAASSLATPAMVVQEVCQQSSILDNSLETLRQVLKAACNQ